MRKKTWAWAAGAVLVLCGAALAAALLTPRAIDVPYEYPIVPGTDEWFAMSGRERKKACQIPEDVLERLTDEALARSVLDYPFLMDMTLYSTPEGGLEATRGQFNGLDELLARPGGFEALAEAAKQAEGEDLSYMYALVVDMISVALGHSTIDDPAREAKLLADYAGQLAAVEVATGRVRRVDAFALRQLKYVAAGGLYDDDYGLSGLMDELSRIFAEQEIAARYADGAEVPANVQSVCLHGYGPLKGQLGDRIPASAAEADPVEFEIELEGSVHGIGLDEGDTYRSSFLELPEQGKQLCSGVEPSHVFTCGVLFGAVVEVNWELADRKTGEIRSSHRAVLVPEDTACLRACAVRGLVDGDGRVYVDSGSPDCAATGEWASMARFEEDLLEDPIRFLTGDAGAVCPGCGR